MYHWGVDNYGGPSTPLFGRQIAAFQGESLPARCPEMQAKCQGMDAWTGHDPSTTEHVSKQD